jgi:predicted RNA-binding Zn ribbon-like protein
MMINSNSPFLYVANNLAIDFVNTTILKFGIPYELLNSKADFILWVKDAGLSLTSDATELDLQNIYAFRQALKVLFEDKMSAQTLSKQALDTLNSHLKNAPSQQQLLQTDIEVTLHPLTNKLTLAAVLGEIAQQAAQVLVSTNKQPIKSCASEKCILMFLDTSRAKKRRWCSMEWCGNRAKAATFYQATKPQ